MVGYGLPRAERQSEAADASVGVRVEHGTALDESNVRKAFNEMLEAAGLGRRGPHQMRHTFALLLLQDGAPITYVSRQLAKGRATPALCGPAIQPRNYHAARSSVIDALQDRWDD
jgi:integrase